MEPVNLWIDLGLEHSRIKLNISFPVQEAFGPGKLMP